jgi:hypothetical protein
VQRHLQLDRAIFFLTQTVVRGMVELGHGGAIVNIRPPGSRGNAIVAVLGGQRPGLHALTRDLAIELALAPVCRPSDPARGQIPAYEGAPECRPLRSRED